MQAVVGPGHATNTCLGAACLQSGLRAAVATAVGGEGHEAAFNGGRGSAASCCAPCTCNSVATTLTSSAIKADGDAEGGGGGYGSSECPPNGAGGTDAKKTEISDEA